MHSRFFAPALAQPCVHALVAALAGHPLKAVGVVLAIVEGGLGGVDPAQVGKVFLEGIVEGVFQQVPVQLALFVPLPEVSHLVAHEVQLLARVHVHIKIEGAQLGAFFRIGAPQLINDGLFAVHHLIVAQRQQIQLVVEVVHAENDLAVGIRTLAEGGGKMSSVSCIQPMSHL